MNSFNNEPQQSDYDYVGYFVEDVCEELRGSYLDNIEIKTDPKTSDFLYSYLIFFYPNLLGHPDNYIKANPMVTPLHIVPE